MSEISTSSKSPWKQNVLGKSIFVKKVSPAVRESSRLRGKLRDLETRGRDPNMAYEKRALIAARVEQIRDFLQTLNAEIDKLLKH